MIYQCPTPIAILLAVYNGEKYLKVQIDSIIEQTNHDWTLYIRDDASTDSTCQIIKDYCAKYDNIILVKDRLGNLGCYENFKELLQVVEADYYMFSDADDYWLPQKVQISYHFLREREKQYPNIPLLAQCDKMIGDADLNVISQSAWNMGRFNPDWISDYKYIPVQIVGGAGAIFNCLVKPYMFEPAPFHVSHDGWLGLQTARYGKIFNIHQSLLIYRRHGRNTTAADPSNQTFSNYLRRFLKFPSTLNYHWKFASHMQKLGYGGKCKYFYFRIVVFYKLMWGYLTYKSKG